MLFFTTRKAEDKKIENKKKIGNETNFVFVRKSLFLCVFVYYYFLFIYCSSSSSSSSSSSASIFSLSKSSMAFIVLLSSLSSLGFRSRFKSQFLFRGAYEMMSYN